MGDGYASEFGPIRSEYCLTAAGMPYDPGRNIRISLLVDIASALGTTVNVLLFGEQKYDHEDYIAEVEDLLYDCNISERMVILDTARAVKKSIMKRRGTL